MQWAFKSKHFKREKKTINDTYTLYIAFNKALNVKFKLILIGYDTIERQIKKSWKCTITSPYT